MCVACMCMCVRVCTGIVRNELICGHTNIVDTSSLFCTRTHTHAHKHTHTRTRTNTKTAHNEQLQKRHSNQSNEQTKQKAKQICGIFVILHSIVYTVAQFDQSWRKSPCLPFKGVLHCHDFTWKQAIKVRNLKPLSLFVSFFALACEGFSSKRIAMKIDAIGPENTLFAGNMSLHLSARKFYRLGQWRG